MADQNVNESLVAVGNTPQNLQNEQAKSSPLSSYAESSPFAGYSPISSYAAHPATAEPSTPINVIVGAENQQQLSQNQIVAGFVRDTLRRQQPEQQSTISRVESIVRK